MVIKKGTIITNKANSRNKENKELDKEYDNLMELLTR